MKECDILGGQNILWPLLHIFRRSGHPRPLITIHWTGVFELWCCINRLLTYSHYSVVRRQSRDEEKLVNSILEGDIRLTVGQAEQLLMDAVKPRRRRRNLVEPTVKRWTLPIPYTFDGSHSQDFFCFFFFFKNCFFFHYRRRRRLQQQPEVYPDSTYSRKRRILQSWEFWSVWVCD